MNYLQAIIIAIVEGITEFLPISSTGHMIIAEHLLGIDINDFTKAFTVNIQFGAILSVVVLYWKRFFRLNPCSIFEKSGTEGKSITARYSIYISRLLYKYDFYWKLLIAVIPSLILGFRFSDIIDKMLESILVVAIMLLLGGVFFLFVDKMFLNKDNTKEATCKNAFIIGLFQCIAMIPGVSRSAASIIGGMQQKLSRTKAAEFSFFLAVPTMAAASGYKLLKDYQHFNLDNLSILLIGNIVAFIVALLAIKFFITYLQKHGFKLFGYYRILVGSILLILLAFGINLTIA